MSARLGLAVAAAALLAGCAGPPTPLTPDQVPAAFIALATAPARTMHMEWSGTFGSGEAGATTPFTASFDFAGADFAGLISISAGFGPEGRPGQTIDVEWALVAGQTYQRTQFSADGRWEKVDTPLGTLDPLRELSTGDVEYVGVEAAEGRQLHHLRVADLSSLTTSMFNGLGGTFGGGIVAFDPDRSTFDFRVDDTAHPVSATLNLTTTRGQADFGAVSLSSDYTFSDWGAEIYIVPPP